MRCLNLFGKIAVVVPMVVSCGTANINKIFGSEDNSYAGLLFRAEQAYDLGDFSEAETLALKAYERSENNGDAGVLLANVYLSQAGIDIFQIVRKLATLSSSKTQTPSSQNDGCTASGQGNQSASNLLSELSCKLLNLTTADKAALGGNQSFPGLASIGVTEVYIPNEVSDTLRSSVSTLSYIDKAVRKLCPFISHTSVLSQSIDDRHTSSSICPDRTSSEFNLAKAHISFAFLNLVEALVYQQGLLIDGVSSASSGYTGVSTVSSKMSQATVSTPADITNFATAMTSFKTIIETAFDTTNPKSQIALALNGFIMVSQSFEAAGVPSTVTSVVTKQLTKLKETASTLKGSASCTDDTKCQSQALKGQMNEKAAKTLAAKINTACANPATCASQKTSLCDSFSGISQGTDPAKVTKPTICQ